MESISAQKCFNHPIREAVARCPECQRFFCRECVTDHDHRLLCASCLEKFSSIPVVHKKKLTGMLRLMQFVINFFILWFFFYYVGQTLIAIPTSIHEGFLAK